MFFSSLLSALSLTENKEKYKVKVFHVATTPKRNNNMDSNFNPLTSGNVLLRSVSLFLSNRRQSKQGKQQTDKGERKKKGPKLSKMDEQMGKLQPKMLEALKKKTHFNK